jgi:hypothetical protein
MISADQLVGHAIGDYILQSDWMAQNKTKANLPAFVHALTYSAVFLIFRPSIAALAVIFATHFFIDRYRLARYVVWGKNWIGPFYEKVAINFGNGEFQQEHWRRKNPTLTFTECAATGYPPTNPAWLSVWLLIIADNILHVVINGFALKYL